MASLLAFFYTTLYTLKTSEFDEETKVVVGNVPFVSPTAPVSCVNVKVFEICE